MIDLGRCLNDNCNARLTLPRIKPGLYHCERCGHPFEIREKPRRPSRNQKSHPKSQQPNA